jgi:hypothetical protein
MSKELNEYLSNLPIHVFKLIDGSSVIARILDEDDDGFILGRPFEIKLGRGRRGLDLELYEWLYGCDAKDTFIAEETIMAHHEATMKLKNFYSKSLLQMKIDEVAEDLDSLDELKDELQIENPFDFIKGIIDGLEPKDSLEDEEYEEEEDFNKPSQNEQYKRRFEWPEEL